MRKAQTITAFLLLAVNIWMRFYAPINKVALVLKHFSLFLIVGIGAYAVTTKIFKKFMSKYKPEGAKENWLYIGRVMSFGLTVVVFSLFQFNYVEFSETPYVEGCQYYDAYNNIVYQSKFYGSCPNLNVITNNKDIFEFSVKEYTDSKAAAVLIMEEDTLNESDSFSLNILSTIKIEYYNDTSIKEIDYNVTYNSNVVGDENFSTYYYYHKVVNNSFVEGYTSVVNEAKKIVTFDYTTSEELVHFDFIDSDYSETTYYLVEGHELIEGYLDTINTFAYELHKDYYNDNQELISEKIANLYSIEENGMQTFTVLPYDLTYINWMGQSVEDIRFDVTLDANEIIWSSESSNSAVDFSSQRVFDRNKGNQLVITKFEFYAPFLEDPNYSRIIEYRNQKQGLTEYVYSQNVSSAIQFPGDYSSRLFSLVDTEYGMRVEHLRFRTQNYINHLIYGEESNADLYYKWKIDSDQFSFSNMFNIEYELIEFENYNNIFFKEPLYITYE